MRLLPPWRIIAAASWALCTRRRSTLKITLPGRSPALAHRIKEEVEKHIGEEYALLTSMVGQARSEVRRDSIVVSGDDWQAALDLDTLVKLLREDRYDEAKQMLADVLRRRK